MKILESQNKLFFRKSHYKTSSCTCSCQTTFRVQFVFVGNFTIYFVNFYLQTFNSGVTDWRFLFKGTFSNLCYQPMSNSVLYPGGGGVSGGYCNENVPKLCSFSRRWQHSKSCKNSVFGWQWRKKSTNVTCILQMSVMGFKTLCALNYPTEKRSYILFKLYIFLQFAKTLICQGHLCPLPLHVAPVYWSYDNALRIYPVPDLIVCADKYDPFSVSQLDTHVVNPVS